MKLHFLNRAAEIERLKKLLGQEEGLFYCLYGRRRCGKSRLLREVLPAERTVYYVGDEREAILQRASLAETIGRRLEGFDRVAYPDWQSLLERWWSDAPSGVILALDEFPYLVRSSPELPSLLQKQIDRYADRPIHLIICGSSHRMMHGLVLDASAPLYGRAREILRIAPLAAGWIRKALSLRSPMDALEAYGVWGGVPRYWELAAEYNNCWAAAEEILFDPLGVLYHEPQRLLLDDTRDTAQATSILFLVGQGCHRLSEIAARLGKPSTSLSHPMKRLIDLGFIRRDKPFGVAKRSSKRTQYRISDPFLLFWFRYVQPNHSRLEAGLAKQVLRETKRDVHRHLGEIWEELVRDAIPRLHLHGKEWNPAARWWGPGTDMKPLECDIVAESSDGQALLVGEVKLKLSGKERTQVLKQLESKIDRLPFAASYTEVVPMLFAAEDASDSRTPHKTIQQVLDARQGND